MSETYWELTIKAFEGYISKPKLEKKFLERPPFLYLMHIYIETMKASKGFGRYLFKDEELSRAYYDLKKTPGLTKEELFERKITFFTKLIKLVAAVSGEPEITEAVKVVKGRECQKTNKFLQELAKAAKSCSDSKAFCKQVLKDLAEGGDDEPEPPKKRASPSKPEPKRGKPRSRPNREDSEEKKPSEGNGRGRFERDTDEQIAQGDVAGRARKPEDKKGDPGIKFGTLKRRRNGADSKPVAKGRNQRNKRPRRQEDGPEPTADELKEIIQKATQSTNQLGNIVEFVEDDIESMSKEYENWARVYNNSKNKLEDLEKNIETELQTYKDKITSKEEQIREKKSQIQSFKTQILRNNEKIQKLLGGIVGT